MRGPIVALKSGEGLPNTVLAGFRSGWFLVFRLEDKCLQNSGNDTANIEDGQYVPKWMKAET